MQPPLRVVGGRFELRGELGRGGMGVVYRALDRTISREVALKVVQQAFTDAESRARFEREGQLTAALRHTNIVAVHSAGVVEGRPFISYELVQGARPLDRVLEKLDVRARVALVRDVARALGHAHAHGIVHRDVKPANVLVDDTGRARVSDFGLATAAGLGRLTETGEVLGTPSYMSPEQLSGSHAITPATDVWALGGILYRALTDEPPFSGASFFQLAGNVLQGPPPRPPSSINPAIPPAFEAVCLAALRRDPTERPGDGEELARMLDDALLGRGAPPPRSKATVVAAALGAVAVLAVVVAAVALAFAPVGDPGRGDVVKATAPAREAPAAPPPAAPPAAVAPAPRPVTRDPPRPTSLDPAVRKALESKEPSTVLGAYLLVERTVVNPHERAYAMLCAGAYDPEAFADLGKLYLDGAPGLERDVEAAKRWLARAIAEGAYRTAPRALAELHYRGPPELRDVDAAIEFAQLAAAKADSKVAEEILGDAYYHRRDYTESARWWGRVAQRGDREGRRHLEDMLVHGLIPADDPNLRYAPYTVSVPADYPRELRELHATGDVAAISSVAYDLADREPALAAPLLARAFERGDPNAGQLLGKLLLGPALPADPDAALELLLRAVARGADAVALERMRKISLPLLTDRFRARHWARVAAAQERPPVVVLRLLGDLLREPPVKDRAGARAAYTRAIELYDDAPARVSLDALER